MADCDRPKDFQAELEAHCAALRKLDSIQLMYRGRVARARALRGFLVQGGRKLQSIAAGVVAWPRSRRRKDLMSVNDRLLRDTGLTRYDVMTSLHRLGETLATWRDRSLQRKLLARFTERDLRDVAISKCDAQAEIEKPFWRA